VIAAINVQCDDAVLEKLRDNTNEENLLWILSKVHRFNVLSLRMRKIAELQWCY